MRPPPHPHKEPAASPSTAACAAGDAVAITLAFLGAHWLRYGSGLFPAWVTLRGAHAAALAAIVAAWLGLFALGGLYRRELLARGMDQLFALFRWVSMGILLLLFAGFALRMRLFLEGRLVLLLAWGFSLAALGVWRLAAVRPLRRRRDAQAVAVSRVLVVGANAEGEEFVNRARADRELRLDPVGFLDDDPTMIGRTAAGLPVLASTSMAALMARDHGVDSIYVAASMLPPSETVQLVNRCMAAGVPVRLVSDSFRLLTSTTEVELVGGVPTVRVRAGDPPGVQLALKRVMDVAISSAALFGLAPVFGLVALAVRVTCGPPVIFRQVRAGQHGRPFCLFKFRTMRDGGDELHRKYAERLITGEDLAYRDGRSQEQIFKPPLDPRVTPVGRVLRKTSLDELPQLVNVLKGEMSLVGPRPPILYELNVYQEWHRRRLSVKPGVTGLWQVYGRSRVPFDQMVILDLYYIDHWSLMNDVKLLARTVPVVLFGRGAY